jgi:hypothetical protein
VVPDEVSDLVHGLLVELPAPQDRARLGLTHELVLVEVPVAEGLGLPDVVEEAGKAQDEVVRGRRVDRREQMLEHVLGRGLLLRRQLALLELGADHGQNAAV